MSDTAVILFNLGGPTSPESVKPFLFNLFNDKSIIGAPQPIRFLLAKTISGRRAPVARKIYNHMGGRSPIHEETQDQAKALEAALKNRLGETFAPGVHIAMRYWGQRAEDVAKELAAKGVKRVVLLPLYPQFSTATSMSSVREWSDQAIRAGLGPAFAGICCYPTSRGFVKGAADRVREVLAENEKASPRILFSAHGLPEKVIKGGDPYRWQVEQTAVAIANELGDVAVDHAVCYQSRVGPLKWIGPSTDAEIERAGKEGKAVLVAPIAFVSEHSETLVELDIEYRALAKQSGVPLYLRARTVGTHPAFIKVLADMVVTALGQGGLASESGGRICPANWSACPMTTA